MGGCLKGFVGIVGVLFLLVIVGAIAGKSGSSTSSSSSTESAAATSRTALAAEIKPTWQTSSQTSKIDDSKNVWVMLESNDPVPGRFVSYDQAQLTIRCMENKTAVMFEFADNFLADIQGYGDITYRIDDRKAQKRGFQESTDNGALGLWSGGSSIPFIKSLMTGQTLFVRVVPFNEDPIDTEFNIAGLDKAITPLRKACAW